ncbi:MAG: COQ9 family protein [Alphaproteobacteria bacterium]|nr:COQ9 family protein [Alphaproteobacteria bacterium]MBV8547957.1 COQ9 family protein [Alphaproteobacteria bacterium]
MPRPAVTSSSKDTEKLLESIIQHVPFDGWSHTSIKAGLQELGVDPFAADDLFPDGPADLVQQFHDYVDQQTLKALKANSGFQRMRTRDKVTTAVRTRFECLIPHREAYRRLQGWQTLPQRWPIAIKALHRSADKIWVACGDTSTDYNRHTKRLLLVGILKATALYWLADESDDYQSTWHFLDRRIGDVMKLGKSISLLKEFRPGEIVEMIRKKTGRN